MSAEVARQFSEENIVPRLQKWRQETDQSYNQIASEKLQQYTNTQKGLYDTMNRELHGLNDQIFRVLQNHNEILSISLFVQTICYLH